LNDVRAAISLNEHPLLSEIRPPPETTTPTPSDRCKLLIDLVELIGIEPMTSGMPFKLARTA
jgi:hypothetical protein